MERQKLFFPCGQVECTKCFISQPRGLISQQKRKDRQGAEQKEHEQPGNSGKDEEAAAAAAACDSGIMRRTVM